MNANTAWDVIAAGAAVSFLLLCAMGVSLLAVDWYTSVVMRVEDFRARNLSVNAPWPDVSDDEMEKAS